MRLSLCHLIFFVMQGYFDTSSGAVDRKLINLISDMQYFYKAPSIVTINDIREGDLSFKRSIVESTREFSKKLVMSQVIQYKALQSTIQLFMKNQITQASEPLFVLFIRDDERFNHFQGLAKNLDMSLNTWFVIIRNKTNIDCENLEGNPFDLSMDTRMVVKCESSSNILKYYSIIENTTEVVELGSWTPEDRLKINSDDNVLHLRKNMKGITLKLALMRQSPYDRSKNLPRFLKSIVRILAHVSNFSTQVVIERDLLGYHNETTNQWSGLMRSMVGKDADIAMVLLSMSNHRRDAVDFSMPLLRSRCRLFMRIPEMINVRWSAYFEVFEKRTWITIGLLILVVSVLLGVTKTGLIFSKTHSYVQNLLGIWGIYCQQGLTETPPNRPTRILYFSTLISSLVLNAVYSATITSYLAVLTTNLPFSNYQELLKSRDYKLILIQESSDELLIYSDDWLLSPFQRLLIDKSEWPTNAYEGFLQLCASKKKLAFHADEFSFKAVDKTRLCSIGSLRMPRIENQVVALAKDSPYTETINYYIMKLMDHGIMNRMKNKYFHQDTVFFDSPPKVMTLWEVMPILAIWAAGVLLSLIILWLELMCKQCFPF